MPALDPLKKAAIYAMSLADEGGDVARVADDWGWKGGKPGEVTGGMYVGELNDAFKRLSKGNVNNPRWLEAETAIYEKYDPKIIAQIENSSNVALKNAFDDDIDAFMEQMKTLEEADFPREWTGRAYPALRSQLQRPYDRIPPILAKQVSDIMRPLTKDQRETFVALLPDWSGSMDELAEAARSL
jgi:hypothetical protein